MNEELVMVPIFLLFFAGMFRFNRHYTLRCFFKGHRWDSGKRIQYCIHRRCSEIRYVGEGV
jgi:hypothetical protein